MAKGYWRIVTRMLPDVEYHQNRYSRELAAVLRPGARWLDVGAGTRLHGGWGDHMPEALAAGAAILVGCDMERPHLRQNPQLTARVAADAGALPFPAASFDVVSANMVLEHLAEPERVFQEIARVLVPGGSVVFVTPNRHHPAVWLLSMFVAGRWRRALGRLTDGRPLEHVFLTHYRANTVRAIRRQGAAADLRPVVLETFPSYPMIQWPRAAVALECLWIRCMRQPWLRPLSSNIIGRLERTAHPPPRGS